MVGTDPTTGCRGQVGGPAGGRRAPGQGSQDGPTTALRPPQVGAPIGADAPWRQVGRVDVRRPHRVTPPMFTCLMPTTERRVPTVHRRRSALPAPVAAEHRPTYRAVARSTAETEAPFGLPVLAEVPDLAAFLGHLHDADLAMGRAVLGLVELLADDEVATTTGVPIEDWIAIVTRHTRMDRRFLLRTARLLTRFPALRRAVREEQVSWPQLRGLSLALRSAPTELDDRLDGFLDQLRLHLGDADPDVVVRQTERAIVEWKAELEPAETDPSRPFFHLQPRLDGAGGRVRGEFDAIGLATLDDATAPRRDQLDHPGGAGGARADNLLARLTHTCQPTPDDEDARARAARNGEAAGGHEDGGDSGSHEDGGNGVSHGDGANGREVASPMDGANSGEGRSGGNGGVGDPGSFDVALPPVRLLLRWDLDALLDRTRTPADLLTRLLGGSLRLTSSAARRLLDARGAEVRSIVVDDGEVLGVGRATRVAPGWLRDASLATHDTCTGPLCRRPAVGSDLDHARPWWPTNPGDVGGSTDLINLGPLCGKTNREKERAGWRVEQRPDGRRTWTHPRSGLRVTSVPATWRPPPSPGPARDRPRPPGRAPRPSGSDPPG
jgi:hypothetical protein